MFTAALFTTAKTWKRPKCPVTEEWLKMWCIYTMEYFSAMKRRKNTICSTIDGPGDHHTESQVTGQAFLG